MASQHRIFKGSIYGANFSTPLKLEPFGNSAKCSYSQELEQKTVPDYENPGGGNAEAFTRIKSAKISLELKKVSAKNVAVALGGNLSVIAAGAVAAEPHTVHQGCLVVLDKLQDLDATLTVTPAAGGDPYVEGVDYIRKRAGFIPLADGDIADAAAVKAAYTSLAGNKIEALVDLTREHRIFLDGIDEVSGDPVAPDFYRVKFSPAKSLEWIGDDFVSLVIEGELLKDETKTGVGASQYTNVKVGF